MKQDPRWTSYKLTIEHEEDVPLGLGLSPAELRDEGADFAPSLLARVLASVGEPQTG